MKFKSFIKISLFFPSFLILTSCDNINKNNSVSTKIETQDFEVYSSLEKNEYYIGESFTSKGLSVINKQTRETILDYKVSIEEGYVFTKEATYNVSISKNNYNTLIVGQITVKKDDKKMILSSSLTKTYYLIGESFSSSGLKLIDSITSEEIKDYSLSISEGTKFTKEETIEVYAKKEGYEKIYVDTINVLSKEKLLISSLPTRTKYLINENFSSSGLVVKKATTNEIVNDYTLSLLDGSELQTVGEISILVKKDGIDEASFTINVYEKPVLSISSKPTKIEYNVDESFSLAGLVVKNEITDEIITDYISSLEEGSVLSTVGEIEVVISKSGYVSTSFKIKVIQGDKIGDKRSLTIYSINDTHGAFTREGKSSYDAGMAYIGSYLKQKKEDDIDNTILVSPGDMWQGGAESNMTKGKIMVDAMNIIGFDCMALGNHEFDWDIDPIKSNKALADFPFISSNIFYSDGSYISDLATPSILLDKGGIKVGIIGACRNNMGSSITGSVASKFKFPDPVSYVKTESDSLRSQGADIVILVTHDEGIENKKGDLGSTMSTKYTSLTTTNSTYNKKYIDCMFFSHDHLVKYGYDNGVPYVEGGCDGKYISSINIELTKTASGYSIDTSNVSQPVDAHTVCTTEDTSISNLKTIKYKAEIGDLNRVLYTFTNTYDNESFTEIICQAMYWYINNHGDEFENTKVSLTSHNTGGVRGSVSTGAFTYANLVAVCPFDNNLTIQKANSKQVSATMSYYKYYKEGEVTYTNGYAYVGSISFISEGTRASNYQTSYTPYTPTAKDALEAYLLQLSPGQL